MSETTITVRTFRMGTDKEAALKPLEEAAEVFGAWQDAAYTCDESFLKNGCCSTDSLAPCTAAGYCHMMEYLADELADVVQAACNLADRYGIDLRAAMARCEERNCERGRYE